MNSNQLLNHLIEKGDTALSSSDKEPYLRSIRTESGIAIHQISVDVLYVPFSEDFILSGNIPQKEIEALEKIAGVIRVNDFALLYRAYMHFKKEKGLDESMRLDFCLELIRLFYKKYSGKILASYEECKKDMNNFIDIVLELQRFDDEMLSPMIKERISMFVYSLVDIMNRNTQVNNYEDNDLAVPVVCEMEEGYCRNKKTNPLLYPGFVNLNIDYSKISLPNCSGR